MPTTFCFAPATPWGPAHIVIYGNGLDNDNNDAFPETANPAYTDVIVNFPDVDTNCQFNLQPYVSTGDMQTLHDASKMVLVSFGNSSSPAERRHPSYHLADQIAPPAACEKFLETTNAVLCYRQTRKNLRTCSEQRFDTVFVAQEASFVFKFKTYSG